MISRYTAAEEEAIARAEAYAYSPEGMAEEEATLRETGMLVTERDLPLSDDWDGPSEADWDAFLETVGGWER